MSEHTVDTTAKAEAEALSHAERYRSRCANELEVEITELRTRRAKQTELHANHVAKVLTSVPIGVPKPPGYTDNRSGYLYDNIANSLHFKVTAIARGSGHDCSHPPPRNVGIAKTLEEAERLQQEATDDRWIAEIQVVWVFDTFTCECCL